MLSLFNSIWPVPIGFLLALIIIMAFFFRKRLFSCLKGKQNSIDSGSYRQQGELNAGLDQPSNSDSVIIDTAPASQITDGQQVYNEINEYPLLILPNRVSDISIISPPVNDPLNRENNPIARNEQDSVGIESPPPSYSSLFYCPPPKYEEVVVVAQ